ncbi:MAG: hypothetical protein HPY45_10840 [Anaerolineae bacterium]|nr:hypothetical protein [Anaerolineae bacterium]
MNGKERARLAFAHQEADRVPIFELTIDNPTAAEVLGRPNLCGFGGMARGVSQNQALMQGKIAQYNHQRLTDEIALWKALDLDVYPMAMPWQRSYQIPEQVDENTWRFTDPATGQWRLCRYAPESDTYDQVDSSLHRGGLAELERLTQYLETHPSSLEDWDFTPVDILIEQLGKDRMVLGMADVEIGSTWDWAETFLIGLIEAPSLIHRYLDANLKTALMLGEEMLRRGVDGLHGGHDWAAQKGPVFSPRHFRQFVFPRLRQITELCHRYNGVYVKHTDGNVNSLIEDMIDAGVDGFQAIEPRAGMDIADLKRRYGDRLTLIGNVDCSTVLVDGPIDLVRRETERIIQTAAPGGGFMLSTSNSVHPGVKPAYYLAMLETARRVGNYPIRNV